MKKHVTVSLDDGVLEDAKRVAGLIPLSRYIENLLLREIAKDRAEKIGQSKG